MKSLLRNIPAIITAATHVSSVYGITNTGNKVFNDQITKIGPIKTNIIKTIDEKNILIKLFILQS
jgi:hypothetical protein